MVHVVEDAIRFSADGLTLEGRLAIPERASCGVVMCHPHPQYGGSMDNNVVAAVVNALQGAGVATLRFNFRGVGTSEGHHEGGEGEGCDARAAAKLLVDHLGGGEITLAGYSFGAIVALMAGQDEAAGISRLAAIAPPVSMFDIGFLKGCTKPKLFVLGDRDPYCPVATLEKIFGVLAEPKEMVPVAGADHFFFGHEAPVAAVVGRFVAPESRI